MWVTFLYVKLLPVTTVSLNILICKEGSNKISLHGIVVIVLWVHLSKVLGTLSDTYNINTPVNVKSSLSPHIIHSTNMYCYLPGLVMDVLHSESILIGQISHFYSLSPRDKSSQEMLSCLGKLEALPWSQRRLHFKGRDPGCPQKLRWNQCSSRLW